MDFNFYKTSLWVTQIMFLKIVLALQLESICLGQYSGNKVQLCFLVRARARAHVCVVGQLKHFHLITMSLLRFLKLYFASNYQSTNMNR